MLQIRPKTVSGGSRPCSATVNTKYLISAFNDDDTFDVDMGYRGTNQFWFGIQAPDKRNYGLELNNQINEIATAALLTPTTNILRINTTVGMTVTNTMANLTKLFINGGTRIATTWKDATVTNTTLTFPGGTGDVTLSGVASVSESTVESKGAFIVNGALINLLGATTFINHGLVGVGPISASALDSFGESFGSMSGLQITGWATNGRAWRSSPRTTRPARTITSCSSAMTTTSSLLPDRCADPTGRT